MKLSYQSISKKSEIFLQSFLVRIQQMTKVIDKHKQTCTTQLFPKERNFISYCERVLVNNATNMIEQTFRSSAAALFDHFPVPSFQILKLTPKNCNRDDTIILLKFQRQIH